MRHGQELQTRQVRTQVETIYNKAKKVEYPFDLKEMKEFFKCRADFEQAKKMLNSVQWHMSGMRTQINKRLDDTTE
jgi:hypothetical protein